MNLTDAWSLSTVFGQFINIHAPFAQNIGDITRLYAVIFRNTVVTRAKRAQAFAKRQMDIQADTVLCIGFGECASQSLQISWNGEILLLPIRNRRIARITRSGNVVFVN